MLMQSTHTLLGTWLPREPCIIILSNRRIMHRSCQKSFGEIFPIKWKFIVVQILKLPLTYTAFLTYPDRRICWKFDSPPRWCCDKTIISCHVKIVKCLGARNQSYNLFWSAAQQSRKNDVGLIINMTHGNLIIRAFMTDILDSFQKRYSNNNFRNKLLTVN